MDDAPPPLHQLALCRFEDLPSDGARGFDPLREGRDVLFIVRRGGALRAYRNSCPHWPGTPMAWRKDGYLSPDGAHIVCYAHGARFDIDTGDCLDGPCPGQSLQTIPLIRRADGLVLVPRDALESRTAS
ncbi:Rieske (2Fe-2S) protein [Azospirillum sp. B510]|uniref:Rieske (2Fe-2S) protein n=1 Tax=Azospirillum sp. (strain B510) TaxID=137722 RepID=UPI0005AB6523|nr:Rieske (2Fe-2S) protein [Azospirillum sp. B510]